VSQHEKNFEKTQALEKNLEAVQDELNKTQSQVQNLQAQCDDAKREQTRQVEQQLHQIRDLEKGLATTKVILDNTLAQKQELQDKYIEELAQKDQKYGDKAKELEEQCSLVKDLTEHHEYFQKHTQELEGQLAFIAKSSAAAEVDSEDVTITDTSASPDISNAKADHLKIDPSLNWSSRSRRGDWKWCVRVGIVQQGPYPDRQLIQLKLPHADSFYSDLLAPIPKPCYDSDVGDKKRCGHCHETYLKTPFQDHGPLCMLFFSHHAVTCKHCKKVFVQSVAFRNHEPDCDKHYNSGAAPEVLAHLTPVSEFAVLDAHMTLLPPDASFSDIATLKNKTLGTNVDSHTLVRALLPYADLDYAQCSLPSPVSKRL
jgi:hypothetical protein